MLPHISEELAYLYFNVSAYTRNTHIYFKDYLTSVLEELVKDTVIVSL